MVVELELMAGLRVCMASSGRKLHYTEIQWLIRRLTKYLGFGLLICRL